MLTLNTTPSLTGARKVTYRPLSSESDLLYLDWVEQNRRRVDELSHGRIGYMHLPDMGEDGIREFIKWYYPQLRKEALLIDDRANGGGNISRMVIQRLTPPAAGSHLCAHHRNTGTIPRQRLYRTESRASSTTTSAFGRRYLSVDVSHGQAGAADRRAHLGRRGGHHQPRAS